MGIALFNDKLLALALKKMMIYGVWPSGKAAGFGPAIRRFESFHPRAALFLINDAF